jgi:mannosyltransferase OCH1-like enzyme
MIPKIIWQTYESEYTALPQNIRTYVESWTKQYPEFEYKYMSAKERKKFVLDNFGQEWYDIFINCPHNIMRANLWRYMVLYVYGGIYFDLDTSPEYPIQSWLNDEFSFIVFSDESEDLLFFIQVIACSPKNIIMKHILDFMLKSFKDAKYNSSNKDNIFFVFNFAGDTAFKDAIKDFLNTNNMLDNKSKHSDYNNSLKAKELRFLCYGDKKYNVFEGEVFKNIDGANSWETGYTSWWKEVGYNNVWNRGK